MGWIQQTAAWRGAAACGGRGLWSLVGRGLPLALPTCITAVGCSGGAGAPHRPPAALGLCWRAYTGAEPWGHAMAPLWGLSPSHLETSQCKPALWKYLDLGFNQAWWGTHANHPALSSLGFWGHDGRPAEVVVVRTALPLHAHPTMCLLRADSPGLPMLTGPHCSGCNTRGFGTPPPHRPQPSPTVPANLSPEEAKPGAGRGHLAVLSSKPRLSPFPDTGKQSRMGRHLGLLQRVFSIILMSTQLFMPQASTVGLVLSLYQALVSTPCNL